MYSECVTFTAKATTPASSSPEQLRTSIYIYEHYIYTRVSALLKMTSYSRTSSPALLCSLHRAPVTITSVGRNLTWTQQQADTLISYKSTDSLAPCEYFSISSKRQRFVSNKDTRPKEPTGTCWVTWWLLVRQPGSDKLKYSSSGGL